VGVSILKTLAFASTACTVIAACGAGGVRPGFDPFPEAQLDTVSVPANTAASLIGELLASEGVEIKYVRPDEGYVETRWFDVHTARTVSPARLETDSTVRLRFWINPATPTESEILGEAAKRRVMDPSLPERETEVPVPPDHSGEKLVKRILAMLRQRTGGQPTSHP
jgi:hypothetical protein